MYDFFYCKEQNFDSDKQLLFLNSYSELNSSTIEMKILLKLQNKGQFYLNNKNDTIPYCSTEILLTEFITQKFAFAINTITTHDTNSQIHPVIPLCYYFGYMKAFSNGKTLVKNQLLRISTPLKNDIIRFSNACWNNKIDQVLSLFDLLEKNHIIYYIADSNL